MVRLPGVENGVERLLVIEIAVATVDGQPRRRNCHEHGAWTPLYHFVALAGGDHDHLMPEARSGTKLGFHIGAHAAAGGRVKSANVGDPHWRLVTGHSSELQVKLC